ncbi:SRPBCC family protein [Ornithinibacillus salinisoli]|uniref:SRPBCC family protein n=1 Tax=Ornithinibacillus salinisoli TaxID=1848459 RepID=A0ABW4VX70_9BACI
MPTITHKQFIQAPVEICFDLARDVDIHTKTTAETKEKAVDGVTTGLLEEGDTVTWEATHFGIKQRLTAKVTHMEKPFEFVDIMIKGAFSSFTHKHQFVERDDGTLMIDTFKYKSPFGLFGVIADKLFLEKYMREFIIHRSIELKKIAENIECIQSHNKEI